MKPEGFEETGPAEKKAKVYRPRHATGLQKSRRSGSGGVLRQ
jgi:hypothetical protein